MLKIKFLDAGGQLFEQTAFKHLHIHPNGARIETSQRSLTARLVLDAMGHFSPIARQARGAQTPDAVCLVVGTCAEGYPKNSTGDLFASLTPMQRHCQYFWEAFPAHDGRTTYLFTYVDTHPDRPTLEDLFADYWQLLPAYQQVTLEQLTLKRALFGFFPCYRQSPLQSPWNHLLFVGDSSGAQSPLSFGGFGAMVRHLPRLTQGIDAALAEDLLDVNALAFLQPYQPNVSVTWLFQKAMSVKVEQTLEANQINELLSVVFGEMEQLGDRVLRPFLQDVVQFPPLFQTLLQTSLHHPTLIAKIIPQVGVPALIEWLGHYINLSLYAGLYPLASAIKPWTNRFSPAQRFYFERWLDAWRYGSGNDY